MFKDFIKIHEKMYFNHLMKLYENHFGCTPNTGFLNLSKS